jgi:membrane protein
MNRTSSKPPSLFLSLLAVGALLAARTVIGPVDSEPRSPPRPLGDDRSGREPRHVQRGRASEPGRGREAKTPWQIPWAGWKDILARTWQQIGEDRLLALVPAVSALVSLYGLFADIGTLGGHLTEIAAVVPPEAMSIVQEQIARVVSKGDTVLGTAFVISLGLALWSANSGVKAVIDALNIVYEEDEKRGFFRLNLTSLALTIGAVGAALFAIGAVMILPLVLSGLGLGSVAESLLHIARWPLLIAGMLGGLAVLYRYGPSRREPRWQWISVGAIAATLAWIAGSLLLSYYLANFAHYDATYGSLAAAMATMMWLWLSSIVILLGGELNAEVEHQTARDSTTGGAKPLGTRGAAMADRVGEARSS